LSEQRDDLYYEIQLTNKQLVFYFLAGATGLILAFLAGVMVGRGVEPGARAEAQVKPVQEEHLVAEPSTSPSTPAAEDLTYAQRLDSDKVDKTLAKPEDARAEKPAPEKGAPAAAQPTAAPARATPAPAKPTPAPAKATRATAKASPEAKASASAAEKTAPARTQAQTKPASHAASQPPESAAAAQARGPQPSGPAGSFTIQVGAFKDKETAASVAARLQKRGFAAYVVTPAGAGLFNVRVGTYSSRADAERIEVRLRDEEKFKPFIVKN
jgi:cell division septation protein DedD